MVFGWLLLLTPLSWAVAYLLGSTSAWTFVASIAAIVPLAEWIREATEQLARRGGAALGGLLNVTFGNTVELALAAFILSVGKDEVVKGQITGSIIGNSLLGLGLAVVAGSIGRQSQTFNRNRACELSSLMTLSTIALLLPALFHYTVQRQYPASLAMREEHLSLGVSAVLVFVYLANLVYTLVTHRDVFALEDGRNQARGPGKPHAWGTGAAVAVLAGATAATALEADLASHALEATAASLGLSPLFMGIVVLAVVGNIAEYFAAVYFARIDRMGVAISITVGSSIQVALLVAPVLVVLSWLLGHPMTLVFSNPLELIAVAAATAVVGAISRDGETTWFEGVLLLAVYVLLAVAFFLS